MDFWIDMEENGLKVHHGHRENISNGMFSLKMEIISTSIGLERLHIDYE
jgi:hypothetical protein